MTKAEAIDLCMEVRDYLTSGNPMWDKEEVGEALDMAITALMAYYKAIYCPQCGRTFTQPEGNPWWIVYRELSGNRLLMGHYDARNGADKHFMYGIGTVMESIAVRCGMQEQWNNEFYANMAESEGKRDRQMTREEAIDMLRHCEAERHCYDGIHGTCKGCNKRIALDMAIEALNDIAKWRTWSHTYDNACMNGEPSEDLISRTEAIEALVKETEAEGAYGYTDITSIVHVISNLPSADRPRGEWINTAPSDRSDNIICDQCGYNSIARYDYCPNCGAKMDRERNEENE